VALATLRTPVALDALVAESHLLGHAPRAVVADMRPPLDALEPKLLEPELNAGNAVRPSCNPCPGPAARFMKPTSATSLSRAFTRRSS
jgi:hypothetical protein